MGRLALIVAVVTLASGCVTKKRQLRADAKIELGTAYLQEGRVEASIGTLEQAVKLDPRNVTAHERLGLALVRRGEPEAAESAFQRALKLDAEATSVRVNYGYLLQKLGRHEDAVAVLEPGEADYTYDKPVVVLSNLGFSYLQVGRTGDALGVLQEATVRGPHYCPAWYNLGLAYEAEHKLEEALDAYEHVLMLCDETSDGSRHRAGLVLLELERCEDGSAYLQAVIDGTEVPEDVLSEARTALAAPCPGVAQADGDP